MDLAGLSRENFTAYQQKQWFWCLKFHELLVREGRTVSAGEERRKSKHPRSTSVSRSTTEMRAMVMTNIRGCSSFGLTASKNL